MAGFSCRLSVILLTVVKRGRVGFPDRPADWSALAWDLEWRAKDACAPQPDLPISDVISIAN